MLACDMLQQSRTSAATRTEACSFRCRQDSTFWCRKVQTCAPRDASARGWWSHDGHTWSSSSSYTPDPPPQETRPDVSGAVNLSRTMLAPKDGNEVQPACVKARDFGICYVCLATWIVTLYNNPQRAQRRNLPIT